MFQIVSRPFWVIHLLFHCFMVFPFQVSSVPSTRDGAGRLRRAAADCVDTRLA